MLKDNTVSDGERTLSDEWTSNADELSTETLEVLDLPFCVISLSSFCTSSFFPLLVSQPTSSASFILSGIGISMDPKSHFWGLLLDLKTENVLVKTLGKFSSESSTARKSVEQQKNK